MQATTPSIRPSVDPVATAFGRLMDHAHPIASGKVEGDGFSWFLATEYLWEVEVACETLLDIGTDSISGSQRLAMSRLLSDMPGVKHALQTFKRNAHCHPDVLADLEWPDWLDVSALPAWREFSIRTAILLSQLGGIVQNDGLYSVPTDHPHN